jgi:hypothetical protein
LTKFVEEKKSPENSQQAIGIPERKGDAESDFANGENGEGVGGGPHASGE